jgi:subtilisin
VFIGFDKTPGPSEQALVQSHDGLIKHSYHLVPAVAASIPQVAIEGLLHNPNVTIVEPDIQVFAVDAELDSSWGVKRIGAGTAHDEGNKGSGIKVAVIDSGVDTSHPDLSVNYVGGYDFVNDDDDPMDDYGHGTHVAGIITAEDNGAGVVGVAPEADLYALKVLSSSGSGFYSDVVAALQWAVDNDIEVTNNSYGSSGSPGSTVRAAFENAEAAGILNVCAAGNSGNSAGTGDKVIYPARYDSCIAVAGTDQADNRVSFSSTGPDVEIAAPALSIYSTTLGGGYGTKSGTSMASPHVAGAAALFIADGVSNVRSALQSTAEDLGDPGWDPLYGYGLVTVAPPSSPGDPQNEPPTVFITNPANGSEYESGDSISFQGNANDDEDGNITADLVWTSNHDGQIGTGGSFSTSSLSDETHTITASVTDSDGANASDSISITVTPASPPLPPSKPINPSPSNGASGQSIDVDISWSDGGGATSYDVYFGTDPTPDSVEFKDNQTGTSYEPGALSYSTTYYWQIDAKNAGGTTTGDIWSFTTEASPPPPTGDDMHVGDLDASKKSNNKGWQVSVIAIIHDDAHKNVEGATVTAAWTGALTKTVSAVTDRKGKVKFNTGRLKSGTSVTLTIIDVTHSALTYESTDNHDPDGSSNGTNIEATR